MGAIMLYTHLSTLFRIVGYSFIILGSLLGALWFFFYARSILFAVLLATGICLPGTLFLGLAKVISLLHINATKLDEVLALLKMEHS
jgi:hypothetical protein